jgi:hypothetical protein
LTVVPPQLFLLNLSEDEIIARLSEELERLIFQQSAAWQSIEAVKDEPSNLLMVTWRIH